MQVYIVADFLGLYGRNPLDAGNVYVATGMNTWLCLWTVFVLETLFYAMRFTSIGIAITWFYCLDFFFLRVFSYQALQPVNVVLAGDSGEGMTGGTIAGIVICNLILNRPHPWIEIYSPTRLPPVSQDTVSQAFEEIQEVAAVSPQTSNTNILITYYAEENWTSTWM